VDAARETERQSVTERAVLDALPRAVVVTDPAGQILMWNGPAEELYGWRADEVVGRSIFDVLVPLPDRERGRQILDEVGVGAEWSGDFTVLRKTGEAVRVRVSDRPVLDEAGNVVAIVGASEDVTDQRFLEQRASDLTEHLRLALDAGGLGTWRWNRTIGEIQWDSKLEQLFGLEPGRFDGRFETYVGLLHPDDAEHVLEVVNEAVEAKSRYVVDHRVLWPDGSVHWMSGAGQVTLDDDGEVTGTIGCVFDVTERVEAERERERFTLDALLAAEDERVSRLRLEFLGRINDVLNEATDRQDLMRDVVRAAVPRLGDWCAIYLLPASDSVVPDSSTPDVEIAHVDPEMLAYATELLARFPYDPASPVGIPAVIRTARTEFYPDITDEVLDEVGLTDEERELVHRLALRSSIAIPLVKRGNVFGAMQFVMSESSRRYTQDDVTLAQAVGARIASSLENRRLADSQRVIASTLQAGLLPTDLPEIPGGEIAVRYWATGEGIDVGGDFYDVFQIGESVWGVAIGDVCGTGPTAAAVTGLVRHTIASAAWHGDEPVEVLAHLNRTMLERRTGSFCTAIYATLRAVEGGLTLDLACGGHPLPILIAADGTVGVLGEPGTLIGVFDETRLNGTTAHLRPGDTVVLYTDGVTDVPPPNQLGAADFAAMVGAASTAATSAEDLADRLHAELSSILPIEQRSDDIALLIIRVS
jgi:PAS domain S-box-containing protein